ncbi:MAG: N-acetylmuramoyl-L-alanine amidase [Deltaproteobacteria bacterium]
MRMIRKMLGIAAVAAIFFLSALPLYASAPDPVAASAEDDLVIVIDPGHGGDDTGAVGPTGVQEKDIVLRLALMAAQELSGYPGFKVLLTRDSDVFIPLAERPEFANRHGADLFISIHANAAPKKDARGVETYFLSFEATDDDARKLAEFENNSAGAVGGAEAPDDVLGDIISDMVRTASHHESARLAEVLHERILEFTGRQDRGVKQAPFRVLVGATMPAVLLEVGFISNAQEEKGLSSGRDQGLIAVSIADGIAGFRQILTKRKAYIGFNRTGSKD